MAFTRTEQDFQDRLPVGVFPTNEESVFWQFTRGILKHYVESRDHLDTIYVEQDVRTSEVYLGQWEELLGLPIAPDGKTLEERRSSVIPRREQGPFTWNRRNQVIEAFIEPTIGEAPAFLPEGLSLDAGGISLLGDITSVAGTYRVYEDVRDFSYEVWIISSTTPDVVGLERELKRITPSGITVTIDNTKANPLSYYRATLNRQPVWYGRFAGNANDSSGYANNGTLNGAPAAHASPGLLVSTNDNTAGYDFDGVDDYISVPDAAQLDVGDVFSLSAWINADDFTSGKYIMDKGANAFALYVDATGKLRLAKKGVGDIAVSTATLVTGTTYHVVAVKIGNVLTKLYVNGVDVTGAVTDQTVASNAAALEIGRNTAGSNWWDGKIDEISVYNYPLTAAQVLENYNTGKNIA